MTETPNGRTAAGWTVSTSRLEKAFAKWKAEQQGVSVSDIVRGWARSDPQFEAFAERYFAASEQEQMA